MSLFPIDAHARYFTYKGLRAEVHCSTAYLIAYAEACALERTGVTADDAPPDELREIVCNASTDQRNELLVCSDNPRRDNKPPPIKQERADDNDGGGKIPALADRALLDHDHGGIPTIVRILRPSSSCQVPLASSPPPPLSDSD